MQTSTKRVSPRSGSRSCSSSTDLNDFPGTSSSGWMVSSRGSGNADGKQIRSFLDVLPIHTRIQFPLGCLTPAELETQSRKEHDLVVDSQPGIVWKESRTSGSLRSY